MIDPDQDLMPVKEAVSVLDLTEAALAVRMATLGLVLVDGRFRRGDLRRLRGTVVRGTEPNPNRHNHGVPTKDRP